MFEIDRNFRKSQRKMKTVTLDLPDDLAEDAMKFGLLDSATLATLLRVELDRCIMDYVNSEIRAYRTEKSLEHNGATNGHEK